MSICVGFIISVWRFKMFLCCLVLSNHDPFFSFLFPFEGFFGLSIHDLLFVFFPFKVSCCCLVWSSRWPILPIALFFCAEPTPEAHLQELEAQLLQLLASDPTSKPIALHGETFQGSSVAHFCLFWFVLTAGCLSAKQHLAKRTVCCDSRNFQFSVWQFGSLWAADFSNWEFF